MFMKRSDLSLKQGGTKFLPCFFKWTLSLIAFRVREKVVIKSKFVPTKSKRILILFIFADYGRFLVVTEGELVTGKI